MSSSRVKLQGVRVAFPSLFTHALFNGSDTGKFELTVLLPKTDVAAKAAIDAAIAEARAEKPNTKVPSVNICVKDGDDEDQFDAYAGHWVIKTGTRKNPTVIHRDKSPIREEGVIYGGCYCNVIVDFWVQDNQWGKRVNCNLWGVQFVRDGEPFGENVDVTDEFDSFDDEF